MKKQPVSHTIWLYRFIWLILSPILALYFSLRIFKHKEDTKRIKERFGIASRHRPKGKLVWFHCASVGESLSVLPLIHQIIKKDSTISILVTSGTVTSASLLAKRLPEKTFHQYIPLDCYFFVRSFYKHWYPDVGVFIESEFWPELLTQSPKKMLLLNTRVSLRSYPRYKKFQWFFKPLVKRFNTAFTQQKQDADHLKSLGHTNVTVAGNLKFDADPLGADSKELEKLQKSLKRRKILVVASTHPGEEELAVNIHLKLKPQIPNLMTIIIPRHPHRGTEISNMMERMPVVAHRRGMGETPQTGGNNHTDIYIADTLGEMGLWYHLAHVTIIAGSLVPHGGHNPLEPLKLNKITLVGPHMFNFTDMMPTLEEKNLVEQGKSLNDIADIALSYLIDSKKRNKQEIHISKEMPKLGGAVEKSVNLVLKQL